MHEFEIVIFCLKKCIFFLFQDDITNTALSILLDYLTDTSVAPLNREFVEIDDPLSNDVRALFIHDCNICFLSGLLKSKFFI